MAVQVVLRHPHLHLWTRAAGLLRLLVGGVLVGVAVLVGPVGLVVLLGYGAEVMGRVTGSAQPGDPGVFDDLPWPTSTLLTAGVLGTGLLVAGLSVGLRLLRHGRTVVLFLRRFRDAEAIGALSAAAAGTVGGFWRVVTLDDGRIAPIGAATGTRRLVRALRGLHALVLLAGRAMPVAPALWTAAAAVIGVRYLLTGTWDLDLVTRTLPRDDAFLGVLPPPPQPIGPDLETLFYLLVVSGIVMFAVGAGFVALLAMLPLVGPALLASSAADAVDRSQALSRALVADSDDLARTRSAVVAGSRRVLAPRLVVVGVDDGCWRESVQAFAEIAAATVVDVSEPSEHVVWEVEQLRTARTRVVPIGHLPELRAVFGVGAAQDPWADRLAELLDGEEVLGYTLTWFGRRRFARALRARLICRAGPARPVPAGVSATRVPPVPHVPGPAPQRR